MISFPNPTVPSALEVSVEDLYENAPVGYLTARIDGVVLRLNGTLSGWLGFDKQSLLGRRIQELLTPGARIFYETHCAPILRAEGVLKQIALDLRRADGSRLPTLVDLRRVDDSDGVPAGYRMMVVEASERRAYERELLAERERARAAAADLARLNADLESRVEARTAELVQLQKVESLGQITGGVAHDFNNLLTPIVACLDILSRKASLDARNARLVAGAAEAAERARLLVGRLLAFARRQRLAAKAVDLRDLVDGMASLIARSIGPMIELRVEDERALPPALVDPHQLELAILNLCVNARDAMEGKGQVKIRLFLAQIGMADPSGLPPGPYVALAVTDTGRGMDAATARRATEPFFTTKTLGQGTGLGLSMAHGLANQSGGALLIDSVPLQGTTVTILLPLATGEVRVHIPPAGDPASAPPSLRVLLVDDEPLVRKAVARMLRDLGHKVAESPSGAQALAMLAKEVPDLLVTDYAMPGMTGTALAAAARERTPGLPVLLLSGFAALAGMETEALPCLSKPFLPAELSGAIAQALAGAAGGAPQFWSPTDLRRASPT